MNIKIPKKCDGEPESCNFMTIVGDKEFCILYSQHIGFQNYPDKPDFCKASELVVIDKIKNTYQTKDSETKNGKNWEELENTPMFHGELFKQKSGEIIATLMKRRGWGNARLAKEMCTTEPYVRRMLSGVANITLFEFGEIVFKLGGIPEVTFTDNLDELKKPHLP